MNQKTIPKKWIFVLAIVMALAGVTALPTPTYAVSSSFGISGHTYPTTLNKGSSFVIKGTISSNAPLKRVEVGVVSQSTGKYVSGAYYNKTGLSAKTFNLANADSAIKFGALPAGNYYYRIWVHDANGTIKRLLNQAFTVKDTGSSANSANTSSASSSSAAAANRFTVSGATYPTTLKKGASFVLKGRLKGTNTITRVEVGVVNKSTGKYVSGYYYNNTKVNNKTFDIAKADAAMKFGALPAGNYYYRIWAHDSKGAVKVLDKAFSVTATGTASASSSSSTAATSRFTVSGATYPTTLKKGASFVLKGSLKGTNTITRVEVGIVSKSTGKYVSGYYYNNTKVNNKTFDIAKADAAMKFGALPAGNYYYRIWVHDSKGAVKVLDKAFSVTATGTASASSLNNTAATSDTDFETFMTQQGFPASYKPYLRTLHKAHPDWKFYAQKTGLSWSNVLTREKTSGTNVVRPGAVSAAHIKSSDTTLYDASWRQASDKAIAYYLDPRNFLNENGIYQFFDHRTSSNAGTKTQVQSLVSQNSCFMNKSTYINALYTSGQNSGVNPCVLTTMVIQEQGWTGTSGLISGKNGTYPGIYNHFNIGAYTTSTMSATLRGLWWAKGAGQGLTSYGRPWNSIQKSLTGGASYFKANYTDNNQYTYYTKKFNVLNGAGNVGAHQYMTNLMGADSEGKLLKRAYDKDNGGLVFRIPVYSSMPNTASPAP